MDACTQPNMRNPSAYQTPLQATFQLKLSGEPVAISTIGQAYEFITSFGNVEWMEFRSLHSEAKVALEAAAENARLSVQTTNALRVLFARARNFSEGAGDARR